VFEVVRPLSDSHEPVGWTGGFDRVDILLELLRVFLPNEGRDKEGFEWLVSRVWGYFWSLCQVRTSLFGILEESNPFGGFNALFRFLTGNVLLFKGIAQRPMGGRRDVRSLAFL
jgi:hypothetical protein